MMDMPPSQNCVDTGKIGAIRTNVPFLFASSLSGVLSGNRNGTVRERWLAVSCLGRARTACSLARLAADPLQDEGSFYVASH